MSDVKFYHMLVMYYGTALIAYVVHRSSHDLRWPKFWFNAHVLGHHYKNYPPSRFQTDTYIFKTNNMLEEADTYVYPIPILTFLIVYCKYVIVTNMMQTALILTLIIIHFYAEVYIHEQVHLTKSWLDGLSLYREIKYLHFIHHRDMHKNHLFTNFLIDYVAGTYGDS